MLGASLGRKPEVTMMSMAVDDDILGSAVVRRMSNSHGKDGSTAAYVKNDLVLKQVLVLHNGIHVGSRTDLIFL